MSILARSSRVLSFRVFSTPLMCFAFPHVNEVDHHQAADVPEAQLARDLRGGLQVGLVGRLLHVLATLPSAGVHINGNEGLRLIYDKIASGFQLDLAAVNRLNLFFHVVVIEDRLFPSVELYIP